MLRNLLESKNCHYFFSGINSRNFRQFPIFSGNQVFQVSFGNGGLWTKRAVGKPIVCANVDSIASKSLKVTVEYDNDLPNQNWQDYNNLTSHVSPLFTTFALKERHGSSSQGSHLTTPGSIRTLGLYGSWGICKVAIPPIIHLTCWNKLQM